MALRDTNSDGKADLIQRFGTTSESGSRGGTGIALRNGALYVDADSEIVRYQLPANDMVPTSDPFEPLSMVTGLVTQGGHPMPPIAVDDRNLFVNMGSATNSCQVRIGRRSLPDRGPAVSCSNAPASGDLRR